VAYPELHIFQGGAGINLTKIIYLRNWELVALAVLSLLGRMHDNFGNITPLIPP